MTLMICREDVYGFPSYKAWKARDHRECPIVKKGSPCIRLGVGHEEAHSAAVHVMTPVGVVWVVGMWLEVI